MYAGIVCTVQIREFPGADKLALADAMGYQVILGRDVPNGALGIFFPPDGQLSHEFCYQNNLYRQGKGENKTPGEFGYFDEKRRIKSLKMRGQISEGFWIPIEKLSYANIPTLTVGTQVSTVTSRDGVEHPICNKYFTQATLKKQREGIAGQQRKQNQMFAKHNDTFNIRYGWDLIKLGTPLVVTLKIHGTSGRTGLVLEDLPKKWYSDGWGKWLVDKLGIPVKTQDWRLVSGTRNTVLGDVPADEYRREIHESFRNKLHSGEVVYYEIAGYDYSTPIMSRHGVDLNSKGEADKFIHKQYGAVITYSYGQEINSHKIYVYRITQVSTDGTAVDLSWDAVKTRCFELGVDHVPELLRTTKEAGTLEHLKTLADGPDPIDARHPREGICVRVDSPRHAIYKFKGWTFSYLEGITKDDEGYVDLEEVS